MVGVYGMVWGWLVGRTNRLPGLRHPWEVIAQVELSRLLRRPSRGVGAAGRVWSPLKPPSRFVSESRDN